MALIHEPDLEVKWKLVEAFFAKTTGKAPDLNGALMLVGIQELGQGVRVFSKEEKQDLMHIGTCKILSYEGYYQLIGLDAEGWPHWENIKPLPPMSLKEQETLLKMQVIEYLRLELGVENI